MKKNTLILAVILIAAITLLSARQTQTQYEYIEVFVTTNLSGKIKLSSLTTGNNVDTKAKYDNLGDAYNDLGKDGWEYIDFMQQTAPGTDLNKAIFKRRK